MLKKHKLIRLMLVQLLAANYSLAQANTVPLTRSENHASFAGKGVASLQPSAPSTSGLHGRRNMPPMGESSQTPIFSKSGGGIRRMPALGADNLHRLPIGPSNSPNKLKMGR
jgi:hypothetical protein